MATLQARNAPSQAPAPAAAATRDSGLKAWLQVLDAGIRALEQSAWQGRKLAGQALSAWRLVELGAADVAEEYHHLAAEARRWPARLKRLSATGWTLTRIAASYRLWGARSALLPRARHAAALDDLHRRNARRFRDTSLRHGGAFLKIGQLLSTRPDLLPAAWVEELETLQDGALPEPAERIRAALAEAFGAPPETLFASFEIEPLAAASIGQVHRAVLHDGREVAVKVQRPGLAEIIELDMKLMRLFADSLSSLLPPTDLPTILDEIERSVRGELDYRREARAMQRIGRGLESVPGVRAPEVITSLSNASVLTTAFVKGEKFTLALNRLHQAGDVQGIADILGRLLDGWLHQVLVLGEFHADPHPGNILLADDGDLVLLDFGCSAELPETHRQGYFRVLQASLVADRDTIAETLAELGFATRSGTPDTLLVFADALLAQIRDAAIEGSGGQISWPTQAQLLERGRTLLAQAEDDPVARIPAEFVLLARVFGSLGGVFMHYQPALDVASCLLRYLTDPEILPAPPRRAGSPWKDWLRLH